MTVYVKDLADKNKRIPVKKPKEKKEKQKKEKAVKTKKEKVAKEKKPKLTKEEKQALKLQEKLLKKQLEEEEERRLKLLMNKIFLFPLQDASPDDKFFQEKFKNFKRVNLNKGKKGKK